MIDRSLLADHPVEVAPRLLGWHLVSELQGVTTSVVITEVEAYAPDDPASHSFRGETPRNASMFCQAGTSYVYRSYGIHWCVNVVTGPVGHGAAVLIRGGRPLIGGDVMARRRRRSDHLTDGPGKLCQSLAIDGSHDGLDLVESGPDALGGVWLQPGPAPAEYVTTPRIGITRAVELSWRFVALGGAPAT
ncbi:MAG: DNA-3-methyladenine glycosylase [Acidimicrobiia bacterium]